jgi:hypothetical protein
MQVIISVIIPMTIVHIKIHPYTNYNSCIVYPYRKHLHLTKVDLSNICESGRNSCMHKSLDKLYLDC